MNASFQHCFRHRVVGKEIRSKRKKEKEMEKEKVQVGGKERN